MKNTEHRRKKGKLRLREADIVLAEQLGADAHDDRHSMTAIETARGLG